MPELIITLNDDDEFPKLQTEAAKQRRTPEAQAEVLVIEGLSLKLKAPPKDTAKSKTGAEKDATANGQPAHASAVPA